MFVRERERVCVCVSFCVCVGEYSERERVCVLVCLCVCTYKCVLTCVYAEYCSMDALIFLDFLGAFVSWSVLGQYGHVHLGK